jgi:uncharacterized protein VirK/YbjX
VSVAFASKLFDRELRVFICIIAEKIDSFKPSLQVTPASKDLDDVIGTSRSMSRKRYPTVA